MWFEQMLLEQRFEKIMLEQVWSKRMVCSQQLLEQIMLEHLSLEHELNWPISNVCKTPDQQFWLRQTFAIIANSIFNGILRPMTQNFLHCQLRLFAKVIINAAC
jgi:hypothetical protein